MTGGVESESKREETRDGERVRVRESLRESEREIGGVKEIERGRTIECVRK